MLYRMTVGVLALATCLMLNTPCMAAAAIALGQPEDIAKDGVAIFTFVNADNLAEAKEKALAGCKALGNASETSKALCKIVATFRNKCMAQALDPQDGTPGFGWAIAASSREAIQQALSKCRDTAGPTRKDACVVGDHNLWCDKPAK